MKLTNYSAEASLYQISVSLSFSTHATFKESLISLPWPGDLILLYPGGLPDLPEKEIVTSVSPVGGQYVVLSMLGKISI